MEDKKNNTVMIKCREITRLMILDIVMIESCEKRVGVNGNYVQEFATIAIRV